MNLVIAILLAQVLFLVAAFGVRPGTSQVACYATSVGLFFFFLCVFSWMLAEGLHIYFMVIRVFGSGRGRKLYYLLIGWGFPFAITAIVVSIFQSRLLSKEICWLSVETGAIWSFVGPAVFVMLVNLIILIMVMRVTSKMLNEESPSSVRSLAKAFVTLLPILGLTWVFGLLSVNSSYIVFEYLFAVFNSLQGLLIFLFFCLRNTEVSTIKCRFEPYAIRRKGLSGRLQPSLIRVREYEFFNLYCTACQNVHTPTRLLQLG